MMNKIFTIGRLTADPTLNNVNGTSCAKFTVASNNNVKNEDGTYQANFYRVSVWGKEGEKAAQWLHKGSRIGMTGELSHRSYVDTKGVERWSLDVRAESIEYPPKSENGGGTATATARNPVSQPVVPETDDLPF